MRRQEFPPALRGYTLVVIKHDRCVLGCGEYGEDRGREYCFNLYLLLTNETGRSQHSEIFRSSNHVVMITYVMSECRCKDTCLRGAAFLLLYFKHQFTSRSR